MSTTQEIVNEKASAKNRITESIRDLYTLKVTLPLGNPNFKLVHTNQFIWLDLPEYFKLTNMERISKALTSSESRFSTYEEGRFYIEGVTITNDGDKFEMELECNPFASSLTTYRDRRSEWMKRYEEELKQWQSEQKNTSNTSSNATTSTTKTAVKSTGNSTLKGGQGATIDNAVKRIVGNETRPYYKALAIHSWLQKNVRYSYYACTRYNTATKCYNNRRHINCADTARLTCAMMRSAGLNAYVVHRTFNGGHFWTVIEINGKKFASDQTGNGSAWNTVWQSSGRRGGGGSAPYTRKCGANPCC